ncbi:hypothetical protein KEJ24_06070 [Candidatus Bathyarchaeota archaeon]|nr:hypothetical protein [Candidatus Bathyarchaeota archaeon]
MERIARLLQKEDAEQRLRELHMQLNELVNHELSLAHSRWVNSKMSLEQCERRLQQEEHAYKELDGRIEKIEHEIKSMKEQIPRLQDELKTLNERVELRQKRISALQEDEQRLLAALEDLENKALTKGETHELTKVRNAYFEKQLALTVAKMFLAKDKQTITAIQNQIENYRGEIARMEREKPQLEQQLLEKHKTIESLKNWLKQLRKEEPELRSRKEALEKQVQKIQAEIKELEEKIRCGKT